jgi:hypothetical protein
MGRGAFNGRSQSLRPEHSSINPQGHWMRLGACYPTCDEGTTDQTSNSETQRDWALLILLEPYFLVHRGEVCCAQEHVTLRRRSSVRVFENRSML